MKKFKLISAGLIAAATAMVLGCGSKQGMRSLAEKHGLETGYALGAGDIYPENMVKILQNDCGIITSENCMKWSYIQPKETFYNWGDVDAIVSFAEKKNMKVKFHTLAWYQQNPAYVNNIKTKEDAIRLLDEHINTIMERYKGRIYCYDALNEMFNEDGTLRDTIWLQTIGPDYIEHILVTAHKADPNAKLYLNEYNDEAVGYPKADALYELVKDFKTRGIPIDGIGMQLHLAADQPFDEAAVRKNLERYAALGIDVSFSEVDVRKKVDGKPESAKAQQDLYCKLMQIALEEKNVKSFICWGFSDVHSWVPASFPGYGEALLYDKALNPKPVYNALMDVLKKQK